MVKKRGIAKVTGDPEVDSIIAALNDKYGKHLVSKGMAKEMGQIVPIPTGSLGLDIALGIGGMPRGRCIEIFGPESSGKTSLALNIASEYEKIKAKIGHEKRWIVIVDVEHSITDDLVRGVGLDPDNVIFIFPDTGEEALNSILDFVKSGKVGFVVFDSIDAVQTEAQLKKKIGENEIGGASKALNRFFREFSKLCKKTQTTAIFINQLKYNPGVMFGSPEVTPGGTAPKFYSSVRLKTMPGKISSDIPNAFTMRVKFVKNKVAPPREGVTEFDFIYATGPDPYLDLITVAKELGIAYFGGSNFMVKWLDEDKENLAQGGIAGALEVLRNNEEVYNKLRMTCLRTAGIPILEDGSVQVEEDDDDQELAEDTD